jgi:hypothetical protein
MEGLVGYETPFYGNPDKHVLIDNVTLQLPAGSILV